MKTPLDIVFVFTSIFSFPWALFLAFILVIVIIAYWIKKYWKKLHSKKALNSKDISSKQMRKKPIGEVLRCFAYWVLVPLFALFVFIFPLHNDIVPFFPCHYGTYEIIYVALAILFFFFIVGILMFMASLEYFFLLLEDEIENIKNYEEYFEKTLQAPIKLIGIILLIIALPYAILTVFANAKFIKTKSGKFGQSITFITNKTRVSSSKNLVFIGDTSKYLFLFNVSTKETYIYSKERISQMRIKRINMKSCEPIKDVSLLDISLCLSNKCFRL